MSYKHTKTKILNVKIDRVAECIMSRSDQNVEKTFISPHKTGPIPFFFFYFFALLAGFSVEAAVDSVLTTCGTSGCLFSWSIREGIYRHRKERKRKRRVSRAEQRCRSMEKIMVLKRIYPVLEQHVVVGREANASAEDVDNAL